MALLPDIDHPEDAALINTLKIDQSFVNRITSNPDDATIVSAVISMGKSLKRRVVAEGVETAEQADFLLAQHCDEGQGHFFGRPVGAEALAALLQAGVSPALPIDGLRQHEGALYLAQQK